MPARSHGVFLDFQLHLYTDSSTFTTPSFAESRLPTANIPLDLASGSEPPDVH